MAALLPDDIPAPGRAQSHVLDMSAGTAIYSVGTDHAFDTMKVTTITFYPDGTAGILESETMRDGQVFFRVFSGQCAMTEAE